MAAEKESVLPESVDNTNLDNEEKTAVGDIEDASKSKDAEKIDSKGDEEKVLENEDCVKPVDGEKTEENRSPDTKSSSEQAEVTTKRTPKKGCIEEAAPVSRRTRSSLSKVGESPSVAKVVESVPIVASPSEDDAEGNTSGLADNSAGVAEVFEESSDSAMDASECYAEVVEEAIEEGDATTADDAQIVEEMECGDKVLPEETTPLLPLEDVIVESDSKDLTTVAATAPAEKPSTPKEQKKVPSIATGHKSTKSPVKELQKQAQTSTKSSPKDSVKHSSKVAIKSGQVKKEKSSEQDDKDAGEKVKRITPSDKTLWVSSISNKTRAADLKTLFSKHGKVSTAKILTNSKTPGARCYGLVTLLSSKDAIACIKNLHHTELHGRVISVEKTRMALKQTTGTTTLKTSVRVDDKSKDTKKDVKSDDKKDASSEKKNDTKKGDEKATEEKKDKFVVSKKDSEKIHSDTKGTDDKKDDKVAAEKKDDIKKKDAKKSDLKKDEMKTDDSKKDGTKKVDKTSRSDRTRTVSESKTTRLSKDKDKPFQNRNRRGGRIQNNRTSNSSLNRRSRSPMGRRRNYSKSPERRDRHGHLIRAPNTFSRSTTRNRSDKSDSLGKKFDDDDREMRRKNRQETLRLERERERLKAEREQLERDKARVLRIEKEQQRAEREKLEREMLELRKYSMMLNIGDDRGSKRSLDREPLWDDRKRSRSHHTNLSPHSLSRVSDVDRRDRHSALSHSDRYYDSTATRGLDRPYHSGGITDTIDSAPGWGNQTSSDHNKYGVPPVIPGIWARMDVPPPVPEQRWGPMESQPRMQPPGPIGHPHPPPASLPQSDQVVMFVPGNGNNTGNLNNQFQSNRFNTNNIRRF